MTNSIMVKGKEPFMEVKATQKTQGRDPKRKRVMPQCADGPRREKARERREERKVEREKAKTKEEGKERERERMEETEGRKEEKAVM